jgi:hypothetical protein
MERNVPFAVNLSSAIKHFQIFTFPAGGEVASTHADLGRRCVEVQPHQFFHVKSHTCDIAETTARVQRGTNISRGCNRTRSMYDTDLPAPYLEVDLLHFGKVWML